MQRLSTPLHLVNDFESFYLSFERDQRSLLMKCILGDQQQLESREEKGGSWIRKGLHSKAKWL